MAVKAVQFTVHPSSAVPVYRQVMEQVHAFIASGKLDAGEMLPSTREMARSLEINMMTISKAYSRLEADGIVKRLPGRGMQICEMTVKGTLAERKTELQEILAPVIYRARQLGLTDRQVESIVQKLLSENQP